MSVTLEPSREEPIAVLLSYNVEALPISVRAFNGLKSAGIEYVGDLVQWTEHDLLEIKNFGRKSFTEIRQTLKDIGLSLEMRYEDLPSQNGIEPKWKKRELSDFNGPERYPQRQKDLPDDWREVFDTIKRTLWNQELAIQNQDRAIKMIGRLVEIVESLARK